MERRLGRPGGMMLLAAGSALATAMAMQQERVRKEPMEDPPGSSGYRPKQGPAQDTRQQRRAAQRAARKAERRGRK